MDTEWYFSSSLKILGGHRAFLIELSKIILIWKSRCLFDFSIKKHLKTNEIFNPTSPHICPGSRTVRSCYQGTRYRGACSDRWFLQSPEGFVLPGWHGHGQKLGLRFTIPVRTRDIVNMQNQDEGGRFGQERHQQLEVSSRVHYRHFVNWGQSGNVRLGKKCCEKTGMENGIWGKFYQILKKIG